ncbi:alpha/beta hydrolase family esterase [Corynebacterium lipophiloflavum]|uniref:Phospholipase/carboxylesterase/thioesterase domain-containing protein n=1 Tax=Corynebacterium lipophiloflavum (strain ATCC 700352 / DSM 44291 / CCUG 37336 / JCM 10383 / DMMZ 1944) TaxID=525263 RepID=C0XP82_CORLD|nr:lpqC protein [Corynebacterium lipophiloflavum]EEI17913.1 hypothetical protein HMPREF0298_0252 [Corynebacterium lipophiloflavum DSM 44291]
MSITRRTLDHQDRQRRYIEVTGENPVPHPETLVLFLHGSLQSGSVARNFTANTFDALATDTTTVLYPDGVGRHFNDLRRGLTESARTLGVDDVGFLKTLISIYDPARVIGCGFSNGGQMLLRMLCEAPATLAGVALFGSAAPTDDNMICSTERWVPTPILCVQGTADPIVPYNGGLAGISEFNRGKARSALDSARFLAQLNHAGEHVTTRPAEGVRVDSFAGEAPVELWSIEGMGHLVPARKRLDPRLGPGTDKVVGAQLVREFFAL